MCSQTEERSVLWQTSQKTKSDGGLPHGGTSGENVFRLPYGHQGAEKEDSIELSWSPRAPATDGPSKPRATSFFLLRKLKGSQPFMKKPTIHLTQLEEEGANNGKDPESDDPDGIKAVTKEFMVQLARAVKDAQTDKKCCYHCSSPEHFICNCLLMKATRDKEQLNGKEGTAMVKGAQSPPKSANATKSPEQEAQEA